MTYRGNRLALPISMFVLAVAALSLFVHYSLATTETSVSGSVKNGAGNPLQGVITFYDADSLTFVGGTLADEEGNYQAFLTPGTYVAQCTVPDSDYADVWWDNGIEVATADHITVGSSPVTGIDFTPQPGGTIRGSVTDTASRPIQGAQVEVYTPTGDLVSLGQTGPDGDYRIAGLAAGGYRIHVQVNAYSEWHAGRQDVDSATQVDVVAGQESAVSIRVDAPSIGGTARVDGTPLAQVWVELVGFGGEPVASSISAADGDWRIFGVAAGDYELVGRTTTGRSWGPVYVGLPATGSLDGYDITYFGGGAVTGTVRSTGGRALSGAMVELYNDNAQITATTRTNDDGTYSIAALEGGWYKMRFLLSGAESWYPSAEDYTRGDSVLVPTSGEVSNIDGVLDVRSATFSSIAGGDRYETAVEISKQAYPDGADAVVLATGANWPDALGGAALSGVLDAPLLLTKKGSLPDVVVEEIERLAPADVYLLGSENAVSSTVERALVSTVGFGRVVRVGGASRYETAALVARRVVDERESRGETFDGTFIVATGNNFPDALAASALSAARGWPIVLSRKDVIPEVTTEILQSEGTDALILGSTAALSEAVERALSDMYGEPDTRRIGGGDRYETAAQVAAYAVEWGGLGADAPAIATGARFPDALAGGTLQAKRSSVLLLTRPASVPPSLSAVLSGMRDSVESLTYLGGTSAIQQETRSQIEQIVR